MTCWHPNWLRGVFFWATDLTLLLVLWLWCGLDSLFSGSAPLFCESSISKVDSCSDTWSSRSQVPCGSGQGHVGCYWFISWWWSKKVKSVCCALLLDNRGAEKTKTRSPITSQATVLLLQASIFSCSMGAPAARRPAGRQSRKCLAPCSASYQLKAEQNVAQWEKSKGRFLSCLAKLESEPGVWTCCRWWRHATAPGKNWFQTLVLLLLLQRQGYSSMLTMWRRIQHSNLVARKGRQSVR